MSSFQTALDEIRKAAESAGAFGGTNDIASALSDISASMASIEPGAAPGMAAGEQDLMGIAAREYEDQLVVPKVLPMLPEAVRFPSIQAEPQEVERGLRTMMTQAAQAIATPGMRAKFLESVLDPLLAVTVGTAARPAAPMMAQAISQALEPSGSGLTVQDLRTEQIAARGAQAGMAAGQQEGVMGDIARGVGQSLPQFAGMAGAVVTGNIPVAAAIAAQAAIPLSSYTAGQLAYMDELDAKRAREALEGRELSDFDMNAMQRRATAAAVVETGVEVIGAATGARFVGKAAKAITATRPGRAVVSTLSNAGQPAVSRILASKAGQAGAQAFARATNGTGRIASGFMGNASRIVLASSAEEGVEELSSAVLQSPFTEAPLSKDLTDGLYSAFIGAAAGGVGGVGGVTAAVGRKAYLNRQDAFRPESDAEVVMRNRHDDAMKARTNWTEELDETQAAEVSVILNSLNGMSPQERGIALRELSDERADIEKKVDILLSYRQELNAALVGARQSQATYETGASERAAKETLVSETQAALDKANADYQAARDALAEMELAADTARPARVARPGRKVVTVEDRQQAVTDAQKMATDAKAALDAATKDALAAEGLEIAPGLRIDPSSTVESLNQEIGQVDAELRLAVTDSMLAGAKYAAAREKIADMPMEFRQQEPVQVLDAVGKASGVQIAEAKAPKRGGRITKELEALGIRAVWFRAPNGKFGSPAFHSMESRGVVYLNADADMSQVRAKALHEVFHDIQMFRPEIAKAYADRVGVAPVYAAGAQYARGRAESAQKARLDALARIQDAALRAGVELPQAAGRAGAARLEQEGQAEVFGATAARVTGRGIINPFVQFAARRGLMGRDVAAAMAVIDTMARAAAVERVQGVKPVATLSPLARTLLWSEDMALDIASEIEQASGMPLAAERPAPAKPAPGVSMARASDADYLAAVERNDMATAQRMVDEAAMEAGYTVRAKHGSQIAGLTKFDLTQRRFDRSERGVAWFSDNDNTVGRYAHTGNYINVQRFIDTLQEDMKSPPQGGVYLQDENGKQVGPFYSYSVASDRLGVFYIPNDSEFEPGYYAYTLGTGDPDVHIGMTPDEAVSGLRNFVANQTSMRPPVTMADVIYDSYLKLENPLVVDMEGKQKTEPWSELVERAKAEGRDGIIVKNVIDIPGSLFGSMPENIEDFAGTVYGVFSPEQIKSADPVTRDEQGNVVPLSKRFDVTTPLISFSREGDAEAASLREQIAVLQRQIRDVQNVTAAQRTNAIREVRILERRLLTAERVAEQKTLQATRAKMRVELEREAAKEDMATADAQIAKLQTRLDAAKASVQSLKQEVSSLRRGENLEQRLADAEETAQRAIDFAYAIGRREGLVAGQVEGQRQERRVVRKLSERLATVEERLDKAVPALREARTQIKQDAAAAQRAIDFAYGMGLAKGRVQGVMEGRRQVLKKMAQREDTLQRQLFELREISRMRADQKEQVADAIRRIATDAVRMLPERLRGPLAVRVANAKTLAQANRVAVEAVKVAANNEIAQSIEAIRKLRKTLNKRGMTYSARTGIGSLLDQAEDGLRTATGRRLRAAVQVQRGAAPALVNAVEVYAAVVNASALVEQAVLRYQVDRQQYLAQRAARIARYDALRQGLVQNMAGRPTLAESERADRAATIPFYRRVSRANSDIYTMMLELEGTDAGVINDLLSAAQAGKGESSLEHASILRQVVPVLQAAGYEDINDYALKNGLLGDASANLRTVQMGGQDVTLPVGTILSIAAMDDETLALFPDKPGVVGQGVTFAGATTTKVFYPSRQDIEAIRSSLSAEERGIVTAMKGVLETQIRDRVMDAVFAVEGDQPPVVQNYWPRVRQSRQKSDASILNASAGNLVRGALTNVGFAQARTGGSEPLIYRDAFQTWERHVQVALDMIHMAQPYRDAATVLTDPAVVSGIDRQFGEGTAERVLAVFSNGVGATARSNPTIIDKLTNNVTGAVLALRPRTLAKVLIGGQLRLASEIPLGYWSKGVARAASRLRSPAAWDARVEEIHSVNGYFSRRHQLHMRSIISGSLSDSDRVTLSTAWQSMIDSFRAAGQNLAAAQLTDAAGRFKDASNGANMMIASVVDMLRYMDEQIMLAAVEARLAEIEDEGVLTGQDALREAALRAERDFRRTQNASDEFDDSLLSAHNRVKGASGWRIFFPFSSDPVKARNQIRRAYLSGERRLETGLAIGSNMAASTIIGAASTATVGYMVSVLAGLLGGDGPSDEEEKKAMEEAKRLPVAVANEAMSSSLGYLGIVLGWVTSAFQYRRAPFTPIAVRPLEQVVRETTGPKPIPERVVAAMLAASQFAGFPMYGLYQFVRDFFPKPHSERESQTPAERLRERMTPEAVRERIRRRMEQLRP
jgi:hypothetical protein